ncbi:Golgi apparatus protein 1 isoform X1 [Anopheles stephensi]|uniref:Golgi apparatus protein 1 isoform X1 n=1 Tax=Anopheles stephensi TaxID=30069 RepID=UPI001658BEEA|nr:Golgi apparatus protein 1 isoform X1 [Anopheles stephensi]
MHKTIDMAASSTVTIVWVVLVATLAAQCQAAGVPVAGPAKLIDEQACSQLKTLCPKSALAAEDIKALECVQSLHPEQIDSLEPDCQHMIWLHTTALMDDANLKRMIQKGCPKDYSQFPCSQSQEPGQFLACIIDHRNVAKGNGCISYIKRLEWVAFSDYRFIKRFLAHCTRDIEALGCGRVATGNDRDKMSQGETVACLQNSLDNLNEECKREVLHLSEVQSEDLTLDRQLDVACSNDAFRFCQSLPAGSPQLLKCLMKHRNDPDMSKHCQQQLLRHDRLVVHDYKVSRGLTRACKEDIKTYRCRRGVSDDKDVRLAQILLCLEAVQKNSTKLMPECVAEINDHRRMLLTDYKLSPEILTGCENDIEKFCSNLDAGGKTIHCLMEHARLKKKKDRRVTDICLRALETLVKVTDVGEDWRVDPVLRKACKPVVDVACSDTDGGDARVMSCLMEKLGTNYMNVECESALLQIQYFVARDFKLDPQLYRSCKDDAIRFCKAKKTWADLDTAQMDPERGPLILPCLHRYAYPEKEEMRLKPECLQEVKRVMRQRAKSVDLIPEVEDQCLDDLAYFCFDKTGKGEEMQCLQDNLEKLQEACKTAVSRYTEEEAAHVELNPIIMTVCADAMEKHCATVLKTGRDEGDMMECLIAAKNLPDMREDIKCRAAVEHFQIISLKSFHFTYKFKEACRLHVSRFCSKCTTKYEVVACLSEVMRNDTIKEAKHSIPKECRQQVRAQLYQQRENIDFDPKLKAACKEDIARHCPQIPHGSGQVNTNNVLECLQTHHGDLTESCHHQLFSIKKSELTDSATDYTLLNTCRDMIRQYCHDTEPAKMLHCLKLHKDESLFDDRCHLVVVNRMIEQNLDYRFNPALQAACSKNIAEYCTPIIRNAKQNEELNGKVIDCLKVRFREGKLLPDCEKQMTEVLHERALNYKLNPLLQSVCHDEIQVLCGAVSEPDANEDHGAVEECLKQAFLDKKLINRACKVEVAELIQEGKADIYADPLLQRACSVDLLKYCSHIQSGNGRLLKCLEGILQGESKALEDDCKNKLLTRLEMFQNAAAYVPPAENFHQLYDQVVASPSKHYFLIVLCTFIGIIFIIGLLCGRVTHRTMALKNK